MSTMDNMPTLHSFPVEHNTTPIARRKEYLDIIIRKFVDKYIFNYRDTISFLRKELQYPKKYTMTTHMPEHQVTKMKQTAVI